jgi:hypothetical protein
MLQGFPQSCRTFVFGAASRCNGGTAWSNKQQPTVRCFTALVNTLLATNESQAQPMTRCCPSRANPRDTCVAPLRSPCSR